MQKKSWKTPSVLVACVLLSPILLKSSFASQDFDLSQFVAQQAPGKRLSRPPVVVWNTAHTTSCSAERDQDQVMRWMQKGCALRQPDQQRCVLVTTPQTTHSILGHLVRFCIEGQS
jgi:hypothetical protein